MNSVLSVDNQLSDPPPLTEWPPPLYSEPRSWDIQDFRNWGFLASGRLRRPKKYDFGICFASFLKGNRSKRDSNPQKNLACGAILPLYSMVQIAPEARAKKWVLGIYTTGNRSQKKTHFQNFRACGAKLPLYNMVQIAPKTRAKKSDFRCLYEGKSLPKENQIFKIFAPAAQNCFCTVWLKSRRRRERKNRILGVYTRVNRAVGARKFCYIGAYTRCEISKNE